ncbi:hypothetical protein K7A41_05790 [Sphingobacterium sp. InxBP1]|uniref:hypothetical protein n=1 Tax=Sphingobacterium sp. InxBP1 TaxID=2870328 RepID=UPI002244D7F1|nr:hypothetical protein [Sphingobacterium sp. InxBP1]MCW8310725.1 hypothetical protein [Sphingobacterium sp. InxBP1]
MAQLVFLNNETELPVPSANIYNSKGNLIGFSDKNGKMELIPEARSLIVYPMDILVQHVSYDPERIRIISNEIKQNVLLRPRENKLKEVEIVSRPADFLCLRGYYRSLETFNLKHKYFSDGIVEFYIPLKKGKVKYRVLNYRIFQDSAVVDEYNKKMWTFFTTPRMAEIFTGKLTDRLKNYEFKNYGDRRTELIKKEKVVGYISPSVDQQSVSLYVDQVLPDSVNLEKILSIEAKTRHDVYIENYRNHKISDLSPKDLINVYQLVTGSIKRKAEYGHIPYEVMNEFYVMDSEFLSTKEYKLLEPTLIKNFNKTYDKSSFSSSFWEELDAYNIPPINDVLANQIGENLKLVN